MKVKLKKGIKPFKYPKFGKVWRIKDGVNIPDKVFDRLKSKVEKPKVKKIITEKVKGVKNG